MNTLLLFLTLFATSALGANPPYGQLGISGKYLVQASTGQQVQLRGMSLWWSQWMPQFYNADTVNALKTSWNANVVRAAMGVEMGGYLDNPNTEIQKVYAVVDAAIAAGIYVVVDWHDNNAQYHQGQAVQFFANISQKYSGYPHIIYEIFNQPQAVSWSSIKPYHLAVISAIRANDPNNVIVVGTPNWCQYVDEASDSPITGQTNIAYSLQFAAGTHGQWNRDKVQYALNKNLPIFVTQYMTVNTDGYGSVNQGEMNAWWNLLDANKISHLNWAIEDKDEPTAAFWPGTNAQQVGDDSKLTPSGQFVKNKLKSYPAGTSAPPPSGSSAAPATTTKAPSTTTKAATTTTKAATTTKASTVMPPSGTPSTPYGQLAVQGKYLVSASTGLPVQLHGMSLFWSQWMAQYYNQATVTALKCSWNTNVVRAAMGVESGGYLDNKQAELQKVYAVIDAAIASGIYVVVDWHDHNAQYHQNDAIQFFTNISQKYGNYPNIIYETYNEPLQVSWSSVLKPYHQAVIAAIRANDPNNVIVVGTPTWSQDVDEAANDPITNYNNIAYTLHYYAGTHKQDLRNRVTTAINKNLPIFVTEYGTVNADGNGGVDQNESNLWWNFLDQNKISYINWSVADKDEGASVLKPGTTASQVGDSTKWTNSGIFVRNKYVSQNNGVSC